jgi:RimJ/RimL family protein N-acetyltransferase
VIELREGDLVIRPLREDDLPALVAACNDPAVAAFAPAVPQPYGDADARAWLALCREGYARGDRLSLAIADAGTDEYLGSVDIRLSGRASVGFMVRPEYRGRGIATRAVQAIVRWAMDEHGVTSLTLTTNPRNVASQRVAEKAGFRRVGTRVDHPPLRDGRTYSLVYELRRNVTA